VTVVINLLGNKMNKKLSIASLGIAMASCAAFTYAEELPLSACIRTKDTKQRLVCYDKAAPGAIRQLNEYDEAKASGLDKKALEVAAKLKEQQKLVRDTVRELRKLSTAIEVGVSKVEYSRRVIDVASTVKLNLSEIDNVALREKIGQALTAYTDAKLFWDGMYNDRYFEIFFDNYGKDTAKYGVTLVTFMATYKHNYALNRNFNNRNYSSFESDCMSLVLMPVWQAATTSIDQADALIANP
jgi:hypothetical protein